MKITYFEQPLMDMDSSICGLEYMFGEDMERWISVYSLEMNNINQTETVEDEAKKVQEVKDWVRQQPHLPQNIPDEQLFIFIHSCYFKLELTKKTIDAYYRMKTTVPEFFSNRFLNDPGLKHITNVVRLAILPKRTKLGYSVILGNLKNSDPSVMNLEDEIKLLFMVVDTCLRAPTLAKGVVFVFDSTGSSLSHLTRIRLSTVKKFMLYIQDAMPLRLKAIHILNVNSVITQLMVMLKPFILKEHYKYIHLHTAGKVSELYDTVSVDMLPEDYGGSEDSLDKLSDNTLKSIRDNEEWFRFDETLRIDKTKTELEKKSDFVGSFKKLELD